MVRGTRSACDKREGNGFLKLFTRNKASRSQWVLVLSAKISTFDVITGLSEAVSEELARAGSAPL